MKVNSDSVSSISEAEIQEFTDIALKRDQTRGWVSDYRYKIFRAKTGTAIVFVNGDMNYLMARRFLFTSLLVLIGSRACRSASVYNDFKKSGAACRGKL